MSLTFEDRKRTIVEKLRKDGKVQVDWLAEQLNVSPETIRRDLDRLEKEGKLKKVYGGAVLSTDSWEPPFIQRAQINHKEKTAIGKLAASLVQANETIMIDNGTTTIEVISHLRERTDVTIITHSMPALQLAAEMFKGKIIFAGGEINANLQSASGTMTEKILDHFKVHKAFISVGGISLVDGITDYDVNEASVSRKMIERADEAIVLADHMKMGKTTFAKISAIQDVSLIITDRDCPPEWINALNEKNIDVRIAD
ncbi:DeoR/GlpR family DNA-binding transcription regulator [Paenibacillus sp. HB172176]|uniref:DeoR/GlpR family DNA-binding transcription regulator n=1 Tax=Paenibacillus sp. HB172176 TaxID=2493690 RepID=UPI00143C25FF|nr:DeoR/GlpR family DNA-binding transcription regulator [Paenibacillus sp. HB172176]